MAKYFRYPIDRILCVLLCLLGFASCNRMKFAEKGTDVNGKPVEGLPVMKEFTGVYGPPPAPYKETIQYNSTEIEIKQ